MERKYFLGIGLLLTNYLFSQWNSNPALNNAMCVQPFDQVNVKIISDLKGGAIAVWEDYRNDPLKKSGDIYAQRINGAGKIIWQINGIAICSDVANQVNPTLVTDSLGGAIIVWEDQRGIKKNLYAQRVDSLGNVLWAANGIPVALRNYEQKNARLLNDLNNGAIILWQDSVGGAYDIYGQRLSPNGTGLWLTGLAICSQPGSQNNPKAQIASTGDTYVTWQDRRNGFNYDIYAQKVSLLGVAEWTVNGISLCNFADTQSNPRIVLDNVGGAIISWQDKRGGISYDVYAQRVNAAGVVQWTLNGVIICNASGSQSAVDITSQNISSGAFIVWKDSRNGLSNVDIYGQFVNLSGAVQWPVNGVPIANNNFNQLSANITGDGSGGGIIAYQDSSAGNWDIKSQRVSATGALLWTTGGVSIGTAIGHQTDHHNVGVESGNSIYAFQDKRSGDNDIYIYKLNVSGKAVGIAQAIGPKNLIGLYPNPSSDKVTFILPNSPEKWILKIMDVNGKEIANEQLGNLNQYEFQEKLIPGIYFFNIYNSSSSEQGKFVITN